MMIPCRSSLLSLLFLVILVTLSKSVDVVEPSIEIVGNNGSPTDVFPLGLCQGDCDSDAECQEGLICHERDAYQEIPGCQGGGTDPSRTDYCIVDPSSMHDFFSSSTTTTASAASSTSSSTTPSATSTTTTTTTQTPAAPTSTEAATSTTTTSTSTTSTTPTTPSTTTSTTTTVEPSTTTTTTTSTTTPSTTTGAPVPANGTLPDISYGGNNGSPAIMFPLGLCMGDCDSDYECQPGLVCQQRDAYEAVAGCNGGLQDSSLTDYCVLESALAATLAPTVTPVPSALITDSPTWAPKNLIYVGNNGSPPSAFPLGHCEGDCDSDADCSPGLYCLQREPNDPVPFCLGSSASTTDFCIDPRNAYIPGHLTTAKLGLLLSQGLDAELVGEFGNNVVYGDGSLSIDPFHARPDAGETFPDTRGNNPGGFVYVSNSEVFEVGGGGVGAITFDKDGVILDYDMVLDGTTWNCGGGATNWSSWVSCEEDPNGEVYQVDPFGVRAPQKVNMNGHKGAYESFSSDIRDPQYPRFFVTEDRLRGALTRFTPSNPDWNDPWTMLHGAGSHDYLVLNTNGTFYWTLDREFAKSNAETMYPNTEGIDVQNGQMYFVCKKIKQLFSLDLDAGTWSSSSTVSGSFDGGPDQLERILNHNNQELLYFTEEGGPNAGIHARDHLGRFYTILEGPGFSAETTGLALSPDHRFMFVAYQNQGHLFKVWRKDGLPFHAQKIDTKFHNVA